MTARSNAGDKVKLVTTIFLFALLVATLRAPAQTNDSPKILFLELQLRTNSVSLVRAAVRPGVLKPRPPVSASSAIYFDLVSKDGQVLWQGSTEDPRSRVIEYEDPPRSGKLRRKTARFDETGFSVRLPSLANAQRVEFYEWEKSGNTQPDRRRIIGIIPLPAN